MKSCQLENVAHYVTQKISSSKVSLSGYVTTDSLLQNKEGRAVALNLPPKVCSLTHYRPGDVLVANIRPYLKKIWFADCSGGCSTDVLVFRAKAGHSADFLFAVLSQDCFFDYAMKGARGSKMPRGDKEQIMRFNVPSVGVEIENKIGNFAILLHKQMMLNRSLNHNLEQMARLLYDYWFVQFDFPDENGRPYKSSGGKMVWNEKLQRFIPELWEATNIGYITISQRGVTYGKDDLIEKGMGVLVLRGNNIQDNKLVYDKNVAYVSNQLVSDTQIIKKYDIIMTMSSGSKSHIGKCAMFYSPSPHTYGAFLSKFTPNSPSLAYYAYLFMSSPCFKNAISNYCNGTGINNLSNDVLDSICFPLPSIDVIRQFHKTTQPIFEQIGINLQQMESLTKLRDELLPLLMNGQVTLNYDLLNG